MLYGVRPEAREKDYPQTGGAAPTPRVGNWVFLGYYLPEGLMPAGDAARYLTDVVEGESLYQCVSDEGALVVVRNNAGREYRVNPSRVIWVAAPALELGDKVRTNVGTTRVGWVSRREWHLKNRRVCYWIEVEKNGHRTRHKRRYWDDELEAIDARNPADTG